MLVSSIDLDRVNINKLGESGKLRAVKCCLQKGVSVIEVVDSV